MQQILKRLHKLGNDNKRFMLILLNVTIDRLFIVN